MSFRKRALAAALCVGAIASLAVGLSPAQAEQTTCAVNGGWNYQQILPTGLGNGVTGTLLFSEHTISIGGTGCVGTNGLRSGLPITNLPIGYSGQCALLVLAGATPSVVLNGTTHYGLQAPGQGDFAPVQRFHRQTLDDLVAKSMANTDACTAGNMSAQGAVTYNL